jgi:signal transduction histidine kinase
MLLNRLVADLRTLSQSEEGNLALNLAPVDPVELAQRQIELYLAQATSHEVALRLDAPRATPSVLADEQRLDQILGNLLGNALRHTPAGGSVTVQVHSLDGAVRFGVVDTGDGIAPDDLARVFDRFYRPDSSRSRRSGGSGLGLAIARRLVEAHHGRIWVESPPSGQDRGSAFYVELRAMS